MGYYPGQSIYCNGTDLTSISGVLIQTIDPGQVPKRTLETYALSRRAGEAVVSSYFDYREIIVKGAIVTTSKALYEIARDTLMGAIVGQQLSLQTSVAGAQRVFYCTLSDNSNLPEIYGGYASFELHFNAYDPFGYDLIATTITLGTTTSGNINYDATFAGSMDARPVITITITSLTAPGTRNISIANANTGLTVTVNRVWSAADVLVIDSKQSVVTVNGVAVPWSGAMPSWSKGVGTIQYMDTFTARNVTLTGNYVKRYV